MAHRRGFTLTEVLMTVVIIGILATMAIPQYNKTLEQTYWRQSRDILMTVYAGQQVYFTLNNQYFNIVDETDPAQWRQIYMDNPNGLPSIPVSFAVSAAGVGVASTFTAAATRLGTGPCGGDGLAIDQTRTLSGTWPETGVC